LPFLSETVYSSDFALVVQFVPLNRPPRRFLLASHLLFFDPLSGGFSVVVCLVFLKYCRSSSGNSVSPRVFLFSGPCTPPFVVGACYQPGSDHSRLPPSSPPFAPPLSTEYPLLRAPISLFIAAFVLRCCAFLRSPQSIFSLGDHACHLVNPPPREYP